MNNVMFVLNIHSVVDIITNSSSELFVGKAQSKEIMIELIQSVYPKYLSEYAQIKSTEELTVDELHTFFRYSCSASKKDYPIIHNFTFEELYDPKAKQNGEIQYQLKRKFVTTENVKNIKEKLDPKHEMYFMFSLDDNTNWEYQEELMTIMDRYHLG